MYRSGKVIDSSNNLKLGVQISHQ